MSNDEDQMYYWMDLQLFSEEKTEDATPKRRQEARNKGQVARSIEINSALVLAGVFAGLKILGPYLLQQASTFMHQWFMQLASKDFTIELTYRLFLEATFIMLKLAMPIMLVALIIGLIANYLQVGFLFSTEAVTLNLDAINPITGFQRVFSKRAIAELIKSLIKIGIVGYVAYKYILEQILFLPNLMQYDLSTSLSKVGEWVFVLAMKVALVLGIMAFFDFVYQRWEFNQNLKMSKQEIKDEHKLQDGDPLIKAKIKERQRMMAVRRMMQEVPKADVVITNPTHFAIALKYDMKTMGAPLVIAKGQDLTAKRIKEIAKEHGVIVVENKPLAQTLFKTTEVGEVIPVDLYQAVAEVLAYVYQLKRLA
jgi:flagellar biosynthetic protein FlhB